MPKYAVLFYGLEGEAQKQITGSDDDRDQHHGHADFKITYKSDGISVFAADAGEHDIGGGTD